MQQELSASDRARLRAETLCDERTIDKWWEGGLLRKSTAERLDGAAKKLKIRKPKTVGGTA